jgi:hypothetical protein
MPTAAKSDAQKICFERKLTFANASDDGFSDTTILTGGVEALGHGLFLDEKSVESCMACLMGKTLPAYLTHGGAWNDRLGKEIGMFSGFYREGAKIKAAKFSFLNAFKKFQQETHQKMVELAQVMPDQFGLSVVFSGDAVYVGADGEEVSSDMPMPEGAMYGMPAVRFSAVESADFVKAPAANPGGLFQKPAPVAAPVDEKGKGEMATNSVIGLDAHNAALAAKDSELSKIAEGHAAELAKRDEAHTAALSKLAEDHKGELAKVGDEIAALKKQVEDAKAFDMRLAGAPALRASLNEKGTELPKPGATDQEKWAQFAALKTEGKDELAALFHAQHIRRK